MFYVFFRFRFLLDTYLGSKLEIIRSASSGDGGEYLPSGGTGCGSEGAFASSVG